MKRILTVVGAIVFASLAAVLPWRAQPADALDVWCWDDPVLSINGRLVAINIGVREADKQKIQAAHITVTVPAGADARVVYIENEFVTPTVTIVHAPVVSNGPRPDSPSSAPQATGGQGPLEITVATLLRTSVDLDYMIEIDRNKKDKYPGNYHRAQSNRFHTVTFTLP